MPVNQWHISDRLVFAQRLHHSSSGNQKQKHQQFQYIKGKSKENIKIKSTFYRVDNLHSREICHGGYPPQPKNNLGGQERLWPHGYCMELYGIAQRTIFVGRNDYGSAMRKETRRGSASYALVWNETHPWLMTSFAAKVWPKLTGNHGKTSDEEGKINRSLDMLLVVPLISYAVNWCQIFIPASGFQIPFINSCESLGFS